MLYRGIIAVCSQIHTKTINTVCGQNVELLNVKLAVHIVTTGLRRVNARSRIYSLSDTHPSILFYICIIFFRSCPTCYILRPTFDRLHKSIFMTMSVCQSVCLSPAEADISKWINYNSWCRSEEQGAGSNNWLFSWRSSPDNNWQHEKAVHIILCSIRNTSRLCRMITLRLAVGSEIKESLWRY